MKYTSISSGKEVEIQKINYYKVFAISNSIEDELRASGEPIDPPTYMVKVGDGEQEHEHFHEIKLDDDGIPELDDDKNEIVLRTSLETDEDHAEWEAHTEALLKSAQLYNERVASFAILHGIIIDMEADTEWEEDQRYHKITIPDDPRDKYLHYLRTEVFPDIIELREVATQILNISIPKRNMETQKSVEQFFRSALEAEQE